MLTCKGVTPVSVYVNGRWQDRVSYQPKCQARAHRWQMSISLWLMGVSHSTEERVDVPDCSTNPCEAKGRYNCCWMEQP